MTGGVKRIVWVTRRKRRGGSIKRFVWRYGDSQPPCSGERSGLGVNLVLWLTVSGSGSPRAPGTDISRTRRKSARKHRRRIIDRLRRGGLIEFPRSKSSLMFPRDVWARRLTPLPTWGNKTQESRIRFFIKTYTDTRKDFICIYSNIESSENHAYSFARLL